MLKKIGPFLLAFIFAVGMIGLGLVAEAEYEIIPLAHPQAPAAELCPTVNLAQHDVDHLVFHCMDHRFQEEINFWIKSELGPNKADVMSWPGVSSVCTDQKMQNETLAAIKLAHDKHHITTVHLINHQDCGGHGGSAKHATSKDEWAYHEAALRKAAKIIRAVFPKLTVRLYFAHPTGIHEFHE